MIRRKALRDEGQSRATWSLDAVTWLGVPYASRSMLLFHLDKLAGHIGPVVYLDLSAVREIVARIDNQTFVAADPIGDNDTITQVAAQRDVFDFDLILLVN